MTVRPIRRPRLSIIAAVADNGVIGNGLDLPWRLRSDLKWFKQITDGKPVLMGSVTWDSLPKKPLPGRMNIVLSRDAKFATDEANHAAIICQSLFEALELAREQAIDEGLDDICIIGGGHIYAQTIEMADRLYITHVHTKPEGQVKFPTIDPTQWLEISAQSHLKGEGDDFDFTIKIYDRIKESKRP